MAETRHSISFFYLSHISSRQSAIGATRTHRTRFLSSAVTSLSLTLNLPLGLSLCAGNSFRSRLKKGLDDETRVANLRQVLIQDSDTLMKQILNRIDCRASSNSLP